MRRPLATAFTALALLAGCTDDAPPSPQIDWDDIEIEACEPDDHPSEWECQDRYGHVYILHGTPPPKVKVRAPAKPVPQLNDRQRDRPKPPPAYKPPPVKPPKLR